MYLAEEALGIHMQTVDKALNDSGLSGDQLTALRQEIESLKSADYRYSPTEPRTDNGGFIFAQAGINNIGGSPSMIVYRGARNVYGKDGIPSNNGYGFSAFRYGRKGFLDLIHHEGGHMTQHLMFKQRYDGTYRQPFGASKELKAHKYMLLLRKYE